MTIAPTAHKPRVVLADDQAATRSVLERVLRAEFEVVLAVGDGRALVDAVAQVSPDAIVTDISMPILDGMDAAQEILTSNPSARVVFVTVHADPLMMRRGWALGGLGFVAKVSAGEQLVPAVRAALRGERWYPCSS